MTDRKPRSPRKAVGVRKRDIRFPTLEHRIGVLERQLEDLYDRLLLVVSLFVMMVLALYLRVLWVG